MTTVAWDGKTLAADTQSSLFRSRAKKIHQLDDGRLYGHSGYLSDGLAVLAWLNGKEEEKPKVSEKFHALLIKDGIAHTMEDNLHLVMHGGKCCALGSGRDFAMAAMFLGKSAEEAVRVAHALDTDTGPEIETLEYSPVPTPATASASAGES